MEAARIWVRNRSLPGRLAPTRVRRPSGSGSAAVLAVALLMALAAATAALAQPGPSADLEITGEVRDDGVGRAVAAAGDVNDDGCVDYVAGADGDDDVDIGSGEVCLFNGPLTHDIGARNADATVVGEAARAGESERPHRVP